MSTEEILDDSVGLIVETSGDSLEDDTELFAEFDDYGKVKAISASGYAICFSLLEP